MVHITNSLTGLKTFSADYRTQYVNIGGECSEDTALMSGVPQGSVLGPT